MDEVNVESLREMIDLANDAAIAEYGSRLQRKVARLADELSKAALDNTAVQSISSLLDEMQELIERTAHEGSGRRGLLSILRRIGEKPRLSEAEFVAIDVDRQRIEGELNGKHALLLVKVEMLNELLRNSQQYCTQLDTYIQAGKQKLTAARASPELTEVTTEQVVLTQADWRENCRIFEQRLENLGLSQTICLQIMAQIRLELQNCTNLAREIQSSLDHAMTAWQQLTVNLKRTNS